MNESTTAPVLKADLVFQGGGVKGIALVGAYSVLEGRGYQTQNVAGASAGAIVGSLVAAGYGAKDLYKLLTETPFTSFMDPTWETKLGLVGKPLSVFMERGIYKGEFAHEWIQKALAEKGVATFGDLRNEGETSTPTGSPSGLHSD